MKNEETSGEIMDALSENKKETKEKKPNKKMKHGKRLLFAFAGILLLNLLAWMAPEIDRMFQVGNWCDWYAGYIMPIWVNVFSRLTNLFPFSFGEIMILLGILLVAAVLVIGVCFLFLHGRNGFSKFAKRFFVFTGYVWIAVCLVMTLNCTILYHCSPLDANPDLPEREYTTSELEILRNYIVEQCNTYSTNMSRDANGYLCYEGDMQEACRQAMRQLADRYPHLAGYYPNVKHMLFSGLMSQAYMAGYYFPFSMEANCNGNMYISNYPETYCHELAHLHGYIYEDEANFLSYLACIQSGDDFLIYCGYLGVLNYVDGAYIESIDRDGTRYYAQPEISEQVAEDNVFLLPEMWEKVEENAMIDTEQVEQISDAFTETSLSLNGVEDGMASYGRVVGLMLQYYEGILY